MGNIEAPPSVLASCRVVGFSCSLCDAFDMCWVCGTQMPVAALSKMPCPPTPLHMLETYSQGSREAFRTPVTPEGVGGPMHMRGHLATASKGGRLPAEVDWRNLHVPLGRRQASESEDDILSGGFGIITRRHTFAGFAVVLKSLREDDGESCVHRADLEREARLHATLSHPNILMCIGTSFEGENGPLSLVLERAPFSLHKWWEHKRGYRLGKGVKISSSSFPKETAILRIDFMLQVSAALVYLHKCQVVHGDIHNGNILVCTAGEGNDPVLKLCDFGRSVDLS